MLSSVKLVWSVMNLSSPELSLILQAGLLPDFLNLPIIIKAAAAVPQGSTEHQELWRQLQRRIRSRNGWQCTEGGGNFPPGKSGNNTKTNINCDKNAEKALPAESVITSILQNEHQSLAWAMGVSRLLSNDKDMTSSVRIPHPNKHVCNSSKDSFTILPEENFLKIFSWEIFLKISSWENIGQLPKCSCVVVLCFLIDLRSTTFLLQPSHNYMIRK